MLAEQRCPGLLLEIFDRGVGPVEGREIADVCQGHGTARMFFPGHSDTDRILIGKAIFPLMAFRTRSHAVDRHPLIVEKPASKLDFGFAHRIVRGNRRRTESGWKAPVIAGSTLGKDKWKPERGGENQHNRRYRLSCKH